MTTLEIRRDIHLDHLGLPSDEELDQAEEEGSLAGNNEYIDLTACSWDEARRTLELERAVLAELRTAASESEAYEGYLEARMHWPEPLDRLFDLEPGVASAVVGLCAFGAVTISSRGGPFAGAASRAEECPYVAFFLAADLAPALLAIAETADVGLVSDEFGIVRLYAPSVDDLMAFAAMLVECAS